MKSVIKIWFPIALLCLAISCEKKGGEKYDATIETSLVGKWEYTINVSYTGVDNTTGLPVSGERTFKGTFTWDDYLHGLLGGDLEECYSYLEGSVDDGHLTFIEDRFTWSENGNYYKAFCTWNSVPVTKKTKEFTTTCGKWSYLDIDYADGHEVHTDDINATFKAKKIN